MCNFRALIILAISCCLTLNQSFAAAFAVHSHSASSLANSHAGSVTGSHDISDSFFNPATLSKPNSAQMILSASYLDVNIDDDNASAKYDVGGSVSGSRNDNAGVDVLIPAFYFSAPISSKTTLGISATVPFGLATNYDENWVGRYHAISSKIESLNINPMISHKMLDDKLSIGAGVQAQYIKTSLTKMVDLAPFVSSGGDAIGKSKGDDWGYGFNLGATFELNDQIELGIGYRSKIDHKLEGKAQVRTSGFSSNLNSSFSTPEVLTFGASYKVNDKIDLLYDSAWTRWSRIKSIDILAVDNSLLDDSLQANWKDSWRHSIGANYQANNKLQLKTGFAYEEGAVDKDREPRIPSGDRIWVSAGFGYQINDNTKIDLTYLHQFFNKNNSHKDNSNAPSGMPISSLDATYKSSLDLIAVGMKFDF
ncbi:MAG: long-chain fatty acid transport protein [Rickettsiales bacterium]|jgi:long-chain fatty acid transport protein